MAAVAPGPAREAACCRTINPELEAAAFAAFDNWTPDLHGPDSRGRLRAALRVVLASGDSGAASIRVSDDPDVLRHPGYGGTDEAKRLRDSGGPREADAAIQQAAAGLRHYADTGRLPFGDVHARWLSGVLSALRAELGRAGTEEREKAVREAAERFLHECHGMLHLKIFSESRRAAHDALRGALDAAPDAERPNG